MRTAAVYSCIAGFAIAAPSSDVVEKFNEFQAKWGRNYVGEEYAKRIQHFADHMEHVKKWQDSELGTATYTYLGPFADASPEEMSQRMGLKAEDTFEVEQMPAAPFLDIELDSSLDWVSRGAVNPIKNQQSCGSCWAFSTACALEGAGKVSSGRLVSVSEQNIVDCDTSDSGCGGGIPARALQWSHRNGGVASESSYRYTARDGSCRRGVSKIIHNQGYQRVSSNENQIAQALAQYGPLSIALDANGFSGYHGGVLRNPSCSISGLNHAVNIVGYGTSGLQYWKVRNSWGTSFGEQGYIRMARGNCQCGLCRQVVYATGVTVGGGDDDSVVV
jgi:C1A family cysteine protease